MIHVVGHLNPDSDAICTAYMTARWLNMRGLAATAWRLGDANRETRFLFARAGLEMPPLLTMPLTDLDVWLVDFTEPAQGPETLQAGNIIGIIDHHRLGGLVTHLPPEVWIKPTGSSATLLWQLMTPAIRAQISPSEALLLLGAMLSDTVTLRSPTTTSDDRLAVDELAKAAGIDLAVFSAELMSAKTSVEGLSASELLQKDIKRFTINGQQVCVAQIELFALSQVADILDAVRAEMNDYVTRSAVDVVVLMLTDINAESSQLWFAGPRQPALSQPVSVEGMLSRKKQMLPWLESHLQPVR